MVHALGPFLPVALLLVLLPGPDSLLVLRASLRDRRTGLATMAGISTGLMVWAAAAAGGLTALVTASRTGYDVLRVVGGLYLVWLGARTLWGRDPVPPAGEQVRPLRRGGYLTGLATNLLNPKIGVFFVSLLPAFVPRGSDVAWTTFGLAAVFIALGLLWLTAIVVFVDRLAGWFRRPRVARLLRRVTGVVLVGFGVRLALERS